MSRAFLNEDKFEQAGDELIERPISPHPNYMTPDGAQSLQSTCERLLKEKASLTKQKDEDAFAKQRLAEIERDLRYYMARLESAILIIPNQQSTEKILFGATVIVEDEFGQTHRFHIVGEDEADVNQHKVSYVSPIAKALLGRRVGDQVVWSRPMGPLRLEIIEFTY